MRSISGGARRGPELRIRPFTPADRPQLVRSLDAKLREKQKQATQHDIVARPGWGTRYARELLALVRKHRGRALVAEVDGRWAGAVFGLPETVDRWALQAHNFSRPFYVAELCVLPRFRRAGVPELLMRSIERWARERGCDWLRTAYHEGVLWEKRLYRSVGYGTSVVIVAQRLRPLRRRA